MNVENIVQVCKLFLIAKAQQLRRNGVCASVRLLRLRDNANQRNRHLIVDGFFDHRRRAESLRHPVR